MKTCIYLSYKGLGANLLHLAYCHEIARKYGPVTIITLCNNLEVALKDDPLIDKIIVLYDEVAPTIKCVLTVMPDKNIMSAVPTVSPTLILERLKAPVSEIKTEFNISVSPAS